MISFIRDLRKWFYCHSNRLQFKFWLFTHCRWIIQLVFYISLSIWSIFKLLIFECRGARGVTVDIGWSGLDYSSSNWKLHTMSAHHLLWYYSFTTPSWPLVSWLPHVSTGLSLFLSTPTLLSDPRKEKMVEVQSMKVGIRVGEMKKVAKQI